MVKLLSIVIAYRNRRQILLNTLKSIEYFSQNYPIEIIIVDDGSSEEHQINDVVELYPKLNIKLTIIKRSSQTHRGPTIACNTGFNNVTGDVILLNNADCLHMADIIGYVFHNFKPKTYLTFAAYKGWELPDGIFDNLDWTKLDNVLRLIEWKDLNSWHFHSPYRDKFDFIPYSAAISTEDIQAISGYDERFAHMGGLGYEDADFVTRISNLGLEIIPIDNPFCVHQKHKPSVFKNRINLDFFLYLEVNFPNRIKITTNKIYNK